jgi:hypothetical protein
MAIVAVALALVVTGVVVALLRHPTETSRSSSSAGPAGPTPTTQASPVPTVSASATRPVPTTIAPIFAVDRYGAKGDGATDDSAAIQAAWNAAHRNNGGTVLFTPGKTYLIRRTAIAMQPIRRNDWYGAKHPTVERSGTILVSGYGATILYPAGTSERYGFMFTGYQGSTTTNTYGRFILAGLTFDDNGRSPQAEVGSIIWTRDQCNVDDVTFKDLKEYGSPPRVHQDDRRNLDGILMIAGVESANDQSRWNYCTNVLVEGCDIKAQAKPIGIYDPYNPTGGFAQNTYLYDNIRVQDCTTDNQHHFGTGIHVVSYGSGNRIFMVNDRCRDSTDNLIEVDACNHLEVRGCHFSKAPCGLGLTWFGYPYLASEPTVVVDDCHYDGGCNPYWDPATSSSTPRNGNLVSTVVLGAGSGGRDRSWGSITISHCTALINGTYGIRSEDSAAVYMRGPFTSVSLRDCAFTEQWPGGLGGDTIQILQDNRSLPSPLSCKLTVARCSFANRGAVTAAVMLGVSGRVDLALDGVVAESSLSAGEQSYVALGVREVTGIQGEFRGAIARLKTANTPAANVIVRPIELVRGTADSVGVSDCDFSLLPKGTPVIYGDGFVAKNNRPPAA